MRPDLHKYYAALGLTPGATALEIKRAYRQLIQRWHPDHFKPGSIMQTTAEDTTKELNEAYEQLYKKQLYKKFPAKAADEVDAEVMTNPAPRARKAYRYEPPPPPEPVRREKTGTEPPPPREKNRTEPPKRRSKPSAGAKAAWPAALRRIPLMKVAAAVALVTAGFAFWPTATPQAVPPLVREHAANTAPVLPASAAIESSVLVKSADQSRSNRPTSAGDGTSASVSISAPDLPHAASSLHLISPSLSGQNPGRTAGLPLPAAFAGISTGAGPARGERSGHGTATDRLATPEREPVTQAMVPATEWGRLLDEAETLIDTFGRGDNKLKVLALQGSPDEARENIFRYGSSLVYFKDGVVTGWADGRPQLRVRSQAEISFGLLDSFRAGSSRQEVFRAQGQPTALVPGGYYYGASAVYFEQDRVTHWIERDQSLRTSPVASPDFENSSRLSGR